MADGNHLNLSGDHAFLPIDMTAYAARPAAISGQESSPPAAKMGVRCVQKVHKERDSVTCRKGTTHVYGR
eukprot:scaffold1988_cov48-Cyclotella_meneghiniana.AAC.2